MYKLLLHPVVVQHPDVQLVLGDLPPIHGGPRLRRPKNTITRLGVRGLAPLVRLLMVSHITDQVRFAGLRRPSSVGDL